MQPDFTLNPQSCPYAKPAPKSPFFRCVSSVLSPVLVANLNWQSVSTDSSLDEPHTPSFRVNLGPVWPSSSHQSSAALAAFRYSRLDSNADVRSVQLERTLEKHSQVKNHSGGQKTSEELISGFGIIKPRPFHAIEYSILL